jgi:hypothetical protein
MKPARAFLFSMTAGLALLFGGRGLISDLTAPQPDVLVGTLPAA